jgi:hypothetical protein
MEEPTPNPSREGNYVATYWGKIKFSFSEKIKGKN